MRPSRAPLHRIAAEFGGADTLGLASLIGLLNERDFPPLALVQHPRDWPALSPQTEHILFREEPAFSGPTFLLIFNSA